MTSSYFLLMAADWLWPAVTRLSLRAVMFWMPSFSKASRPMSKVSCLVRRVWTLDKSLRKSSKEERLKLSMQKI